MFSIIYNAINILLINAFATSRRSIHAPFGFFERQEGTGQRALQSPRGLLL